MPGSSFRRLVAGLLLMAVGADLDLAGARAGEDPLDDQEELPAESAEVVVTASRLGGPEGVWTERVRVISREELEAWSGASLADLLVRSSVVDVRRRSPAQSDLSLRGSGFEQVLVLVDGVPVADPQTGHHNLDLPLCVDDIERIEVLPGVGSSVYGPGAHSGVVQIVTRSGLSEEAVFRTAGGSFSSVTSSLSVSGNRLVGEEQPWALALGGRFSAGLERSLGHRPGTEVLSLVLSPGAVVFHPGGTTRLRIGFQDKRFGADGFYGPYPSREATNTLLALFSSSLGDPDQLEVLPRLSFRRHRDRFILDRNHPADYASDHLTQVLGAELALRLRRTAVGGLVVGIEHNQQRLESSSLGGHERQRTAAFAENEIRLSRRLQLAWGLRVDWGMSSESIPLGFVSPSVAVRALPTPAWVVVLSAGRGFRLPSFTELYYYSPANRGDPTLSGETSWAGDLSVTWQAGHGLRIGLSAFVKSDSDLVDWIKSVEVEPWKATNVGSMVAAGGELRLTWKPRWDTRLDIGYTRLELSADSPKPYSKYVFRQPIDDVLFCAEAPLVYQLEGILTGRYRRRPGQQGALLLDARLRRRFGPADLYIQVLNLLDARDEEITGVPLPGISVGAGMSLTYR